MDWGTHDNIRHLPKRLMRKELRLLMFPPHNVDGDELEGDLLLDEGDGDALGACGLFGAVEFEDHFALVGVGAGGEGGCGGSWEDRRKGWEMEMGLIPSSAPVFIPSRVGWVACHCQWVLQYKDISG